ncbi:MAG: prolipoprotein diacylglyceryl transferase, partial [Clostridiales bacterium]|nr:prolipoprotein diacylglyceryl transferase [Clostridiales bacterium]
AIGRWGNFANQEAYGRLVTNESLQWFPYAVFIEDEGAYYQATFFYESFLNAIGFALMMWIYNGKRKSFDGFSLSVYCIWYGVVRFFIEGLRSDSLYLIPDVLRVSQLLSAILVVFGIAMILGHMYRARARDLKPFIMVDKAKLNDTYFGYAESILSHPNVYEKKEKGFFAKMFARTEDTPDPEDIPEESVGEEEQTPEEVTVTVPAQEDATGASDTAENDGITVTVPAQDDPPPPEKPIGAKRPRGN